jgi:hypothetical protein
LALATLINENLRFLHLPKTGGSWATQAMFAAGVQADRPAHVPFHGGLADTLAFTDRFTFAFVRHPLDFWLSYWNYRVRTGWEHDHGIDRVAASSDFGEFIDAVIERAPGAASALYEQYVGRPEEEICFVGRTELLAEDLCMALRLSGERFDESQLRSLPAVNRSDFVRHPGLYTRDAAERLAAAEDAAIERFYAHEPIPGRLLEQSQGGPWPVKRRLQRSTIELRDTRGELSALRRTHHLQRGALEAQARALEAQTRAMQTQARELANAREALHLLRSGRLLRWSRPLRVSWYAFRRRRLAGASATRLARVRRLAPQARRDSPSAVGAARLMSRARSPQKLAQLAAGTKPARR